MLARRSVRPGAQLSKCKQPSKNQRGGDSVARCQHGTEVPACTGPSFGSRRQSRVRQRRFTMCSAGFDSPMDRPEVGEPGIRLPSQAESIVKGVDSIPGLAVAERPTEGNDLDYLQVRKRPC